MKNVALITGASSGIGKELAIVHAEQKGDLVIVARRIELLNELKDMLENEHEVNVYTIQKDLSKRKAAIEIYNEVKENNIEIDYLINCAGFGGAGPFHKRTLQYNQDMVMVNVLAVTSLTQLFLEDFLKRDYGKILNVGSTAGESPGIPLHALYAATKKFEKMFTNAINFECKNTNVSLSTLIPDFTKTEFNQVAGFKEVGISPRLVAEKGYKGMLDKKYNIPVGFSLHRRILSIFQEFFPTRFKLNYMNNFIKKSFK